MKLNISSKEFFERLDLVPKELQEAYFSVEKTNIVETIIKKYSLGEEQANRLQENTAWALIGLLHPDSLKEILIKDLGVSMVVSAAIVGDLNHELFIPHKKSITEVLLTYPPKKEWLETTAPSAPSPTIKPVAPTTPRIIQPLPQVQSTISDKPTPSTNPRNTMAPMSPGRSIPDTQYKIQDTKPTMRPIAPPPLQVSKPLGSRPSILEVQRGTDGIRRAPQAPVGGYETKPPVIPDAPRAVGNPERSSSPVPSQTPTNVPQTMDSRLRGNDITTPQPAPAQTPHVMFKYVHPEPPAVSQVPPQQIPSTKFQAPNPSTNSVSSPQAGSQPSPSGFGGQAGNLAPTPPGNSIPDSRYQLPDTKERDTFHKTQEEHKKSLPIEHRVMDLEEYHQASAQGFGGHGTTQQGNMLNLKE